MLLNSGVIQTLDLDSISGPSHLSGGLRSPSSLISYYCMCSSSVDQFFTCYHLHHSIGGGAVEVSAVKYFVFILLTYDADGDDIDVDDRDHISSQ